MTYNFNCRIQVEGLLEIWRSKVTYTAEMVTCQKRCKIEKL